MFFTYAAPLPVGATVSWVDGAGQRGSTPFQGTADGTVLRGAVTDGNSELRIDGTMRVDGSISGTLSNTSATVVGSFAGTRSSASQLEGTYSLVGGGGGTWTSPADALPTPAPATLP